jgi:hypothetical protein
MATQGLRGGWPYALALAALLLVAFAPWRAAPGDGVPSRLVLLEEDARLRADGTEFAFTVRRPSTVKVQVRLPAGLSSEVVVGRAKPANKGDVAYAPDEEGAWRFEVMGEGSASRVYRAVGLYILRITTPSGGVLPPGATAHVRVESSDLE